MNTDRLHKMIDRYFSGELDMKEEQYLLEKLLSLKGLDRKAEEALAVMSWTHLKPQPKVNKDRVINSKKKTGTQATAFIIVTSAAAAVAIICGIFFFLQQKEYSNPNCYAYIDGKCVNNPEEVSLMIFNQLEEMSFASNETANKALSELEEMRIALKSEITDYSNNCNK